MLYEPQRLDAYLKTDEGHVAVAALVANMIATARTFNDPVVTPMLIKLAKDCGSALYDEKNAVSQRAAAMEASSRRQGSQTAREPKHHALYAKQIIVQILYHVRTGPPTPPDHPSSANTSI